MAMTANCPGYLAEHSIQPMGETSLFSMWIEACRTIHAPAANSAAWPIFQLLFGP